MRGFPLRPLYRVISHLSLQRKVFLSYVVLILVPMAILTWFSYHRSAEVVRRQTMQSAEQVFDEAARQLDALADKAIGALNTVSLDGQINAILATDADRYDIPSQLTDYNRMTPFLQNIEKSQGVYRVRLYLDDRFVFSDDGARLSPLSRLAGEDWYARMNASGASAYWFVPRRDAGAVAVVSVARTVWSLVDFTKPVGVARVDIPLADVERIVTEAQLTASSYVLLRSDESGETVAASRPDAGSAAGAEGGDAAGAAGGSELASGDGGGANRQMLLRSVAIPGTSWSLVSHVSLKEALRPLTDLRNRMIVMMLVITALSYVVAYFYSRLSTIRIKRLSSRMRLVQNGDLPVVMTVGGKDEIGELTESFNFMVRRMDGLVQEKFRMGKELKNAELRTLQAQINPHLLYNSLDTINCLAIEHQVPDISRMVLSLTRFYKLGLSQGKELVPLRAELQHIRAYIGIMNMRYEEAIELIVEVPPELQTCLVPRTILQPIVENAVLHGIMETERKRGSISISAAKRDSGSYLLQIGDDGKGIPPGELAGLLKRPVSADSEAEGGFGLRNVNDRLQLTFGEEYGLSIHSEEERGTTVSLRLPIGASAA
ncbi:cache domain-containing sensor histidine kinase [Cohnella fermenti]|nr:sensor histidine kinase [Cohnella fermenti]